MVADGPDIEAIKAANNLFYEAFGALDMEKMELGINPCYPAVGRW
jgi:hypothetical protein